MFIYFILLLRSSEKEAVIEERKQTFDNFLKFIISKKLITHHLIQFLKSNEDVPEFSNKIKRMFRLPSYPTKKLNNSIKFDLSLNQNANSMNNNFSPNDKSFNTSKMEKKKEKEKTSEGSADEDSDDITPVKVEVEKHFKKEEQIVVNFFR